MDPRCPNCGEEANTINPIEEIIDDTPLLVMPENRVQLYCPDCGWMAYQTVPVHKVVNFEI